jgi:WD40 repeat protein
MLFGGVLDSIQEHAGHAQVFHCTETGPPPYQFQTPCSRVQKRVRQTFLCLLIALLVAIFSFVLIPIIVLLFLPGLLDGDTLTWAWVFFGPALLALPLSISFTVGFIAFLVAKARLPDRPWLSAQTLVIVVPYVAIVLAATVTEWRFYWMTHAPEIGPQQKGLPSLHLARTWTGHDSSSHKWRLTWSADGEWFATYGVRGILMSSPDGKYEKEFPLRPFALNNVLRYLSGHRLLITSPVIEVNSASPVVHFSSDEMRNNLSHTAFSVIDAEAGKVLHNISGPNPDGPSLNNTAIDLAVSPDERFVAVICGHPPQIEIYSTIDWNQIAALDLHTGERDDLLFPDALAFSPDGKMLAVIHRFSGRIKFFQVGSWTLSSSLATYLDEARPINSVGLGALAFSPDGAMIAVGATRGGTWWTHPHGMFGSGEFKYEFPADPLRVYRVSDGRLITSLGSFPGGFHRSGLVWSPNGEYLAFLDAVADIRFWNPFQSDLSVAVARKAAGNGTLLFSRDGSQLAANFLDEVKIFDVVPPH